MSSFLVVVAVAAVGLEDVDGGDDGLLLLLELVMIGLARSSIDDADD